MSQERSFDETLPYHYLMLDTTYKTLNTEITFLLIGIEMVIFFFSWTQLFAWHRTHIREKQKEHLTPDSWIFKNVSTLHA